MSPAEKEVRQIIADKKLQEASTREYDRASGLPAIATRAVPAAPKRSAAVEEAIQEMQDEKARKKISGMGFAKGGKVGSASKRADGIASKGKTRGRII